MRRNRKIGIAAGVAGVLLVGTFVVADRIALSKAREQIAARTATELASRNISTSDGDPVVTIEGFPFLTQVLTGEYDRITIHVADVVASGIALDSIDMSVDGIEADAAELLSGSGRITAKTVTGTAVLGQESIRAALVISGLPDADPADVDVSVQDGTVNLSLPLTIYEQDVVFNATGTLAVQNGVISLDITEVEAEGVPDVAAVRQAVEQYKDMMTVDIDVPSLPYDLVIDTVETTDAGISVVARADNVLLAE